VRLQQQLRLQQLRRSPPPLQAEVLQATLLQATLLQVELLLAELLQCRPELRLRLLSETELNEAGSWHIPKLVSELRGGIMKAPDRQIGGFLFASPKVAALGFARRGIT
jgi:hypothetical protein